VHFALPLPKVVVFALAGLACGYVVSQIVRALLARRWPIVEGEIVDARVIGNSDNPRSLGALVTYRYHVGGKSYTNNRVRFGLRNASTSIIPALNSASYPGAQLAATYPRHRRVRVYYNPRRPDDSVLHPAPDATVWSLLVLALYFAYGAVQGWP